jgi:CRISPR-associated endonuclease Cas2
LYMGELERKHTKTLRKSRIQTAILTTIKAAGILTAAAIAPKTLRYLSQLDKKITLKNTRSIRAAKKRLFLDGYLILEDGNYKLSKKGEDLLDRFESGAIPVHHHKKWDKRWRFVIFDIPESSKSIREKVRRQFQAQGFKRIQDSVWVYPYDCEDFIALLKTEYRLGKNILYLIVEYMENDEVLIKNFNLPIDS